jgi:hypothetical protein
MKFSPAAEKLLARVEARERSQQRERARPMRQIVLDPTWPFPSAPIGALAGKNPLDEGD